EKSTAVDRLGPPARLGGPRDLELSRRFAAPQVVDSERAAASGRVGQQDAGSCRIETGRDADASRVNAINDIFNCLRLFAGDPQLDNAHGSRAVGEAERPEPDPVAVAQRAKEDAGVFFESVEVD